MTAWLEYEAVHGKSPTVTGRLVVWPKLESPQLGGARDIVVYLPPSLAKSWRADPSAAPLDGAAAKHYPVLYFNDGQNVFDEKTSYVGEEWKADETLEALAKEGLEAIAVAIPNGVKQRMEEYNPWRSTLPFKRLPAWADRREMGGQGDAYLEWLVTSVNPLISRSFPVAGIAERTAIIGSSMGGLISLYAFAARPETFGLIGALSPSLPWSGYRILDELRARGTDGGRLYVDVGVKEGYGMLRDARRLRRLLLEIGFADDQDLRYVEDRAGIHRESAWARRLPDALRFLLRPTDLRPTD